LTKQTIVLVVMSLFLCIFCKEPPLQPPTQAPTPPTPLLHSYAYFPI